MCNEYSLALATCISSWVSCQPQTPRLSSSSEGKMLLGITPTPLWFKQVNIEQMGWSEY